VSDNQDPSVHAARAARVLAAARPSTVPPPLGDRTEAIAAIERALRARAGRRWRRKWVVPSLATVAAAAAVLLLATSGRDRPRDAGGRRVPAGPTAVPDELTLGASLRGPATLVVGIGTRLNLDGRANGQAIEVGNTQRFRLDEGGLRAEVAKLAPGHRFIVQTPDAEVEVKGTRFDVVVSPVAGDCAPATRTRVMVHEGVVAVRFAGSERLLRPGATWPLCPSAAAPAPSATAVSPASMGTGGPPAGASFRPQRERVAVRGARVAGNSATVAAAVPAPLEAPPRAVPALEPMLHGAGANYSTLADQNDLLAAALAARHRGDVAEALRWLDRLLLHYPAGQLADSARAERRRLLDGDAGLRLQAPR